jgi:dimethylhistidine N-methyltransferase
MTKRPTAPALRSLRDGGEPDALRRGFFDDVAEGLGRTHKTLPCKYLYDERGSALFEAICSLDEYYPTRVETALLAGHAAAVAAYAGAGATVIELGSGSSAKVRQLLDRLEAPAAYMPVDISREALEAGAASIAAGYPGLAVRPVVADYLCDDLPMPVPQTGGAGRILAFFPGSTIGNFTPDEARDFLTGLGARLGGDALLLVGVDLKKPRDILERAYNDAKGVTAAFNLNLLVRINRELGGTFDLGGFAHRAHYDETLGRVEMHLESLRPQIVRVGGRVFRFDAGETIHTEISCKYTRPEFARLAASAGWRSVRAWADADALFSLHLLTCVS